MRISIIIILFIVCSKLIFAQSNKERIIDSLQVQLEKLTEDSLISATLIRLSGQYLNLDTEKALEYAEKSIEFSKKSGDNSRLAASYNTIGNVYQRSSKYDLAIESYKKALEIVYTLKDQYLLANIFNNLGNVYDGKSQFNLAVEHYIKALKIYDTDKDLNGKAVTLNNIGLSYYRQEEYEKALEYYNQSLELRKELNDVEGEALAYNNIGIIYYELGKVELVLEYFKKSLKIYEDAGDIRQQSLPLYNIGQVYYEDGDFDEAIKYFKKSLEIDLELGDMSSVATTYDFIGRLYREIGIYDLALKYQFEGLKIAEEVGSIMSMKDSYQGLSETYDSIGDFKKAYEYHKLYKYFTDSIFNIDKHSQLVEMQTIYETEKKDQELQIKTLAFDKQVAENERKNVLIYTFIAGFAIILIFAFIIFRMFIQKKKANIKLESMNAEILQQKEEIQAQSEQLIEINQELEKLSIVARETDNSVVLADSNGEIEWVNDAFVRTTGYSKSEFVETFGNNILAASKNSEIQKILNECIKNKKSVEYVSMLENKEGKEVWFQTTLTPILDSNDNIKKLVAIDSNITALKNAEKEILKQKQEIEHQHDLIFEQKKEITDSIKYAEKIQTAIMPPELYLKKYLPEYFLLFMPKDIISGDFYYAKKHKDKLVFCVADCTGHGVPGAFMSMLGIALLNEIINNSINIDLKASDILELLRENIIKSLHQTGIDDETKDGMDITMCILDKEKKILQFAGANNPLYIVTSEKLQEKDVIASETKQSEKDYVTNVRNDDRILYEIKGDKMPIGIHIGQAQNFTNNIIKINSGDMIYLFSDGFADQFGGKKGKKYKYAPFKKLLFENSYLELNSQKQCLSETIQSWMCYINPETNNNYEQIDDICILGVKL